MGRKAIGFCLLAALLPVASPASPEPSSDCSGGGVWLQVLGSGGPELVDGRASSGYLVRIDGKARVMVDAGGGTALQFARSGADFADLHALLFTHLHVDHSGDLPALVKASYFGDRQRNLPLFGPTGNEVMPALGEFVFGLFGPGRGSYRYLGDFLDPNQSSAYKLIVVNVAAEGKEIWSGVTRDGVRISAVPVHHGPIPALAWRVDVGERSVVFSGDMSGRHGTLEQLARGADLLVAHNAVPEGVGGTARELHMPPSEIGRIAAAAGVGRLVLSHRMARTLGKEDETVRAVREAYEAPVAFAEDLDCFRVGG